MRVLFGILVFMGAVLCFCEVAGTTTCPDEYTPCNDGSGECYLTFAKCGHPGWCSHGSIDQTAVCQGPPDEGFMKCKDPRYWFPIEAACNHWRWCRDGADEDPEMCGDLQCPEGKVKCKNGRSCFTSHEVCDKMTRFIDN